MLYMVSLGLHDEKDISLKGIDALRKCEKVFMENYTSSIKVDIPVLESLIWKRIEVIGRKEVEEECTILYSAKNCPTGFIVPGDALSATTHNQIVIEARKLGIPVQVIHGSSIFSAVAETGLSLYKFGMTVSVPKPQENYFPTSPYDYIFENRMRGLHTLILLDIGMTAKEGIKLLLLLEEKMNKKLFSNNARLIAVAHLGENSTIKYGTIADLKDADLGALPHTLILPGELHFSEDEFLRQFRI